MELSPPKPKPRRGAETGVAIAGTAAAGAAAADAVPVTVSRAVSTRPATAVVAGADAADEADDADEDAAPKPLRWVPVPMFSALFTFTVDCSAV